MGFLEVVFFLLILLGLILLLAYTPGAIARKRHSPWAQAVSVMGWVGILFVPIWILALAAAFIRPRKPAASQFLVAVAIVVGGIAVAIVLGGIVFVFRR